MRYVIEESVNYRIRSMLKDCLIAEHNEYELAVKHCEALNKADAEYVCANERGV